MLKQNDAMDHAQTTEPQGTGPLSGAPGYYLELGEGRYRSTIHAQGAWNPQEQHMAPVTGLLVRELERFQPREDLRLARLSFDILGRIPGGEFQVQTRMLRPGRSIELVQAELTAGGRVAVRVTAWRLQLSDTSEVAVSNDPAMPGPESAAEQHDMSMWPGGFTRSLELRVLPGWAPGRGRVWLRGGVGLVAQRPSSELARLLGLADVANGIAPIVDPSQGRYIYPNIDLSVHLYRSPRGDWLGLNTSVSFGVEGIGLTSSVLYDEAGPFGRAEQILTVRRISSVGRIPG